MQANGFNTSVQDKITQRQSTRAPRCHFESKRLEETVEVTANVSQVDTEGATLGSVETTRRIQDLPLVERDTFQLGLLQAGVYSPDPDDGSKNPFSSLASVRSR